MDPPAVHLLWDSLVTLLCDLFSVERTNLFLAVPEQQLLRSRAASSFTWDIELPWDVGVAGRVYQEKTPLLLNDVPNSEFGHYFNKDPKGFQTQSMLTVPVYREGDEQQPIVAIIQLVNKIDGDFSEQEMEALRYWSRQIGVSLERTHGTEIWRHPESEPPHLEDPAFDPVIPGMATKQASLALPGFINLLVCELGNCGLQLRRLSWSQSFWESRELINIVRNGYRHTRIAHQLSGETTSDEKRLGFWHRYFTRVIRWTCGLSRNAILCHTLTAFEEWLSFYSSTFAYWLSQHRPKEKNLLHSLIEDKRSHCIFYECILLESLIQHPNRIEEYRLYHRLFNLFYGFMARRMVKTVAHVSQRPELTGLFATHFKAFTSHRSQALWDRAQARNKINHSAWRRVLRMAVGTVSLFAMSGLGLLIAPVALLVPIKHPPTTEEEIPELLPHGKAA